MDLLTPSIGLIFWQTILFILLFFLLKKFAWKPIFNFIDKREKYLKSSLEEAKKNKEKTKSLEFEKKKWLKKRYIERELFIKETNILSNQIIEKAKENAKNEYQKLILQAKNVIEDQKKLLLIDIKNKIADISINIAEKLLQKELKNNKNQEKFISNLLTNLKNLF